MARNRLPLNRFGTAEYQRQLWCVTPEAGTEIDTILSDPGYWAQVVQHMKPDHEILVRDPAQRYRLHLLVRACGPDWATVAPLSLHRFEPSKTGAAVG